MFLFTTASRTALRPTQPPIQWVPGTLSLEVKRSGHEADHSPPSSAEIKEWVELYLHSPNTPSWRDAQLRHRDNFTFALSSWVLWVRDSWPSIYFVFKRRSVYIVIITKWKGCNWLQPLDIYMESFHWHKFEGRLYTVGMLFSSYSPLPLMMHLDSSLALFAVVAVFCILIHTGSGSVLRMTPVSQSITEKHGRMYESVSKSFRTES
jgi:hypothetical protein